MSKKSKKAKNDSSEIRDSAHNIWLAGLGSLAIAEQEGTKLFRKLVERGRDAEGRLAEPVEVATKSVKGTVRDMRKRAETAVRSFESVIDEHVKRALGRLGLPTHEDLAELKRQVDALHGSAAPARRKTKTKTKAKTKAAKSGRK